MNQNYDYTQAEFDQLLRRCLLAEFSVEDVASATADQVYRALALVCRKLMSDKRKRFMAQTYGEGSKQVYYLCVEF